MSGQRPVWLRPALAVAAGATVGVVGYLVWRRYSRRSVTADLRALVLEQLDNATRDAVLTIEKTAADFCEKNMAKTKSGGIQHRTYPLVLNLALEAQIQACAPAVKGSDRLLGTCSMYATYMLQHTCGIVQHVSS